MAYELPVLIVSIEADADLSAKQYYVVGVTGKNKVDVRTTATQVPLGILQNKPSANQTAEVMVFGVSKASADAAVTGGDLFGSSGDGQILKLNTDNSGKYRLGQVLAGVASAAALATVIVGLAPSDGA